MIIFVISQIAFLTQKKKVYIQKMVVVVVVVVESCLTISTLWIIAPRLLCSWESPGKNPGVDCHSLLQWIFLTQGPNESPTLQADSFLYYLSHQESPLGTILATRAMLPLRDSVLNVWIRHLEKCTTLECSGFSSDSIIWKTPITSLSKQTHD